MPDSPLTPSEAAERLGDTGPARFIGLKCGYVYDPALGDPKSGIAPGTPFSALPEGWRCPKCHAAKEKFAPEA